MRKIAGDGDIAVVDRLATGGLEPREQMGVAIRLGVVFVAGIERAAAERNSQDVVGHISGARGERSGGCHHADVGAARQVTDHLLGITPPELVHILVPF